MKTLSTLHQRLSAPQIFWLIALLVALTLLAGLYLQHGLGIQPCPLCIVQRLAFIAVGISALIAALFATFSLGKSRWALAFGGLTALLALAGAGVAAWHVWIKKYPPESFSCGRPFAWMLDNMPLTDVLPKLFRGEADCLQDTWTLLGLSIAHWSFLLFVLLAGLALSALYKTAKKSLQ